MSRGVSDKITYKPYNQGGQWLVWTNWFRCEKLKDSIEEIFVSTVRLLNRKGYVSLEKYFVDGTKIYKIHLT